MRVLLLNSRLSERGGADRWLLGVLARLQGQFETLLAVGYEDRALPRAERARIGPVLRIKGLDERGLGRRAGGAADGLGRLIGELEPHVVHVNDVTDPEVLEVVAASGRGVQTVQDHRFFCPGRGKVDAADRPCHDPMGESCLRCFEDAAYGERVIDLTRRRLASLLRMKRITVLSRYMAHELAALGVPPHRLARIPPFVDDLPVEPAPLAGAGRAEFHLMAGRLTSHKGVEVALAAARALRSDLPLVVAGDGPLAGAVAEASRNAGGRLRYVGWADRRALAALRRRARSLWLPGLWAEPFGIAGLEAMAAGVPVISSAGGGVSDWLADGETGLLVEPGSVSNLANAADRLASQPDLAERLGRMGRERAARRFDPGELMGELLAVYTGVAGAS